MKNLEEIIKDVTSFRQAAEILNTNHSKIQRLTKKLNIDTSHFKFKNSQQMIGMTISNLTIKSTYYKGDGRKKRLFALCDCKCGKVKEVRFDSLKSGRYISCGCHKRSCEGMLKNKNHSFKGYGELNKTIFDQYKRSAERRDIEFNITIEYIWNLYESQNRLCTITKLPLFFGRSNYPNETNASLDRIDSSKGYVEGNLQWVLKDINIMKGVKDMKAFLILCNIITFCNPLIEETQKLIEDYKLSIQN